MRPTRPLGAVSILVLLLLPVVWTTTARTDHASDMAEAAADYTPAADSIATTKASMSMS